MSDGLSIGQRGLAQTSGPWGLSIGGGGNNDVAASIVSRRSAPTGRISIIHGAQSLSIVSRRAAPTGWASVSHVATPSQYGLTIGEHGEAQGPPWGLHIGGPGAGNRALSIVSRRPAPMAVAQLRHVVRATIQSRRAPPTSRLVTAYDLNLLSALHAIHSASWNEAARVTSGMAVPIREAPRMTGDGVARWNDAAGLRNETRITWTGAPRVVAAAAPAWREATSRPSRSVRITWTGAPRVVAAAAPAWREATQAARGTIIAWGNPARLAAELRIRWGDAPALARSLRSRIGDAPRLEATLILPWVQAGYPANARRSGPPIPPISPDPIDTALHIVCLATDTHALSIGRSCIITVRRIVPVRSSYVSINTASLVRLPDLAPIPCASIDIETDFESWCWALTATLKTPTAWPLVQPNPLACEVRAVINGYQWDFLLDVPSLSRSFNSDTITIKGRSRSAWLHEPFTRPTTVTNASFREIQQLAEEALDNTGWTLSWGLPSWSVPAGRYTLTGTPIAQLLYLVGITGDGLYTDPYQKIMYSNPRWKVASWLLDAETVDVLVPEAAIRSLSQEPVYTAPINGVYVSGTTVGCQALVKIAGTDGALQPIEPITHDLLCDVSGVAARQRGLNALSDAGAGYDLSADLLLTSDAGLLLPGMIANISGIKGVVRSVKIHAEWRGNEGLQVSQSVGLERREVEA